MTRIAAFLACAAGLFWLSTLAPAGPPGGVFAHRGQRKETKKEAKAVARIAPKLADDDANVQQFEQQFGPQFRQLYKSELHFMRLVCQPTKAQYQKIAADGEPGLKAAIRKFAATWRNGMGDDSDPRAPVAEAVAKAVRDNLPADQAAKYQKELDARAAARNRVFRQNLVAAMDRLLVLSAEQRTKLTEVLEANRDASWENPMWLWNLGTYFPRMPDDKIMPLLTENQKTVWRGVSKGAVRFGFNINAVIEQGAEVDEDGWDVGPPPAQGPDKGATKAVAK